MKAGMNAYLRILAVFYLYGALVHLADLLSLGHHLGQKAAADLGWHEWEFKPRFCIMFPLVVCEGELTVDEDMDDVWCMKRENRTHPILPAVEREVRHLFPEDVARRLLSEGYGSAAPAGTRPGYLPKKATMP